MNQRCAGRGVSELGTTGSLASLLVARSTMHANRHVHSLGLSLSIAPRLFRRPVYGQYSLLLFT